MSVIVIILCLLLGWPFTGPLVQANAAVTRPLSPQPAFNQPNWPNGVATPQYFIPTTTEYSTWPPKEETPCPPCEEKSDSSPPKSDGERAWELFVSVMCGMLVMVVHRLWRVGRDWFKGKKSLEDKIEELRKEVENQSKNTFSTPFPSLCWET